LVLFLQELKKHDTTGATYKSKYDIDIYQTINKSINDNQTADNALQSTTNTKKKSNYYSTNSNLNNHVS
jgi:hypothetical protein